MSCPQRVIPDFPYADLLDAPHFGDFRDQLRDDGFVVVKHAIPLERAKELHGRAMGWLEGYGAGFQRNDPTTWTQPHLPAFIRGGMYFSYGISQEQWTWDIRCEPGIKAAFEKLWGTKELVCSMDGGSLMIPGNAPPASDSSWPHIDLCPSRKGFFVAQGIVNLQENGPEDGGLQVMKGSSRLTKQFFDEYGRPPIPHEGKIDFHMFTEAEKAWFVAKGCEWLKVCAGPGDLILWDSATIHQNCAPSGKRDRTVTYVCMGPASLQSAEDIEVRTAAFNGGYATSHAPFHGSFGVNRIPTRPETGEIDPKAGWRHQPVQATEEVLKLASVVAY